MGRKYDFCGWATKNDLHCSDGRVIRRDAFKECDGIEVPLVWQHQHNSPENVLGHALLENRAEGVYMYGIFNDTDNGRNAKKMVEHGDITHLSIYANQLKQKGENVLHGAIREVSLVLAGANPGATIEFPILAHSGEICEDEAIISSIENDTKIELYHAEEKVETEERKEESKMAEKDKTVKEVFDSFSEEQKNVVYFMIGQALEEANKGGSKEGEEEMKHNVFENGENNYEGDALMHDAMNAIIGDAKRLGSMKESFLAHAEEYGIDNIEYLFPDEKNLDNAPQWIKRNDDWVDAFMKKTHHTPFSRIKSMFADITEDDARAKGYLKGNMKKNEFFALMKRTTTPTTIYKKQKLDRDDILDINDFDVVSWLKTEMRMMLNEEIARAALLSDGRDDSSDDKISELNIRPIWTDEDLFTIKQTVTVASTATEDQICKEFIKQAIKARKNYKGSGNPILFTTEDMLTDMLLMEDSLGHPLYESEEKLRTKLRVSQIVTVPVMENQTRTVDSVVRTLMGIIVNPIDYNIGADKGGAINMFDDFDIDYNQQKYLIETRCSGALTKPYSAIALEKVVSA